MLSSSARHRGSVYMMSKNHCKCVPYVIAAASLATYNSLLSIFANAPVEIPEVWKRAEVSLWSECVQVTVKIVGLLVSQLL